MTEIKPPFGPLIFYIDIGREMAAFLFYWFCVTGLPLFKYRACQISLISLNFIEILLFLIRFEPLRWPLIRKQTVLFFYYNFIMEI